MSAKPGFHAGPLSRSNWNLKFYVTKTQKKNKDGQNNHLPLPNTNVLNLTDST